MLATQSYGRRFNTWLDAAEPLDVVPKSSRGGGEWRR